MDKHKNIFIENKSIKVWDKVFKTTILYLIIIIPTLTFIFVYYMNPAIEYYFSYFDSIKENFGDSVIVSKRFMLFFIWSSFSIFIISLIFIFFIPVVFGKKIKLTTKVIYTILIALFLILSIILSSIAEYNYSKFYNLFIFLASQDPNVPFISDLSELQSIFYNMYNNGDIINSTKYKWTSDTSTWWICIFKIIITIIYFAILLNSLEIKKEIESERVIVRKNLDQSKISYLFNKLTINNSKNISAWLICATLIVFLPQLVFISIMSIFNTEMNSLLNWTFIAPDLIKSKDFNLNELYNIHSSVFIIKSLPIIISGFLMGTMSIFFLVYTKGWSTNNTFFKSQFIVMFIEILLIISITTYSSNRIQYIVDVWNNNNIGEIINNDFTNDDVIEVLKNMLGISFLSNSNNVKNPWLSGLEYASQTIISISFISTIYVILGDKMMKINQKKFKKSKKTFK